MKRDACANDPIQLSNSRPHSRGAISPGVCPCRSALKRRGRRECRVPAAPAASRAKVNKAHERSRHRFTRLARHSLRNGFTAYSVISPATNSSCHRRQRIESASRPVGRKLPPRTWHQQRVSGPHGFTVRFSAVRLSRRRRSRGSSRPAKALRARRCRVHRIPCPTSVTIAIRPSSRAGTAKVLALICPTTKAEYFRARGWTGFSDLPVGAELADAITSTMSVARAKADIT